ncbi:MAG: chaplin family protein [Carbonactinosporaceae bacterium]
MSRSCPAKLEVSMPRFAKGVLVAVLATGGFALSDLGIAAADTGVRAANSDFGSSGYGGSGAAGEAAGSGTTFALPIGAIVTLCGDGTALLGGAEADCAPTSRGAPGPAGDGGAEAGGVLAGGVNPLLAVPVSVCDGSLAVLGVANADCAAVRAAVQRVWESQASAGDDAGAPVGLPISVPVTVCGSDVAVLGTAEADCAATQAASQVPSDAPTDATAEAAPDATPEPEGSLPPAVSPADIGDDRPGATPDAAPPATGNSPPPSIPVTVCGRSAAGPADTDCAVTSTQARQARQAPPASSQMAPRSAPRQAPQWVPQSVPQSVPLLPGESGPLSAGGPVPLVPRLGLPRADPAPTGIPNVEPALPSVQPSASLTPAATPTPTPTPTTTPTTGASQPQSGGLGSLASTGTIALIAAPIGVALIAGGYLLYRRFRPVAAR